MKISFEDFKYLVLTIFGEARGEIHDGQLAVAMVILNRAKKRNCSIKDVVLAPYQFSCWNANDPNFKLISNPLFDLNTSTVRDIIDVCVAALEKTIDPTKGATHYCTITTDPYWAVGKTPCYTAGKHKFYNDVA